MKVGLVDVDSHNFPNLVLMKLSAWHKSRGDQVELLKPADILKGQNLFGGYDKLYGACVFDWNRSITEKLEQFGVYMGGVRYTIQGQSADRRTGTHFPGLFTVWN